MSTITIVSFLTHPGHKNAPKAPAVKGTQLTRAKSKKLFDLLAKIFAASDSECKIDIAFRPTAAGTQANPVRQQLVDFTRTPGLRAGRVIAQRLQQVTTLRSGLGLLFLMSATDKTGTKLVVSRFPTESAIFAETRGSSLSVEFLERIFMKKATSYKAVVYKSASLAAALSTGRAVDRQLNTPTSTSDYWIRDFLDSSLAMTSATGTRYFANAFRRALDSTTDLDSKAKLIAVAQVARTRNRTESAADILRTLALDPRTDALLRKQLGPDERLTAVFTMDTTEFDRCLPYRTMALDNDGMLTAPAANFNKVFTVTPVGDLAAKRVVVTTEGVVTNETLRKSRR